MGTQEAEDLRAAGRYIEEKGLHKCAFAKDYTDPDSPVCSWGAIKAVAGDVIASYLSAHPADKALNPRTTRAATALATSLGLNGPFDIPLWNDAEERTQAEVVKQFYKTADEVEFQ